MTPAVRIMGSQNWISKLVVWTSQNPAIHSQTPVYKFWQWFLWQYKLDPSTPFSVPFSNTRFSPSPDVYRLFMIICLQRSQCELGSAGEPKGCKSRDELPIGSQKWNPKITPEIRKKRNISTYKNTNSWGSTCSSFPCLSYQVCVCVCVHVCVCVFWDPTKKQTFYGTAGHPWSPVVTWLVPKTSCSAARPPKAPAMRACCLGKSQGGRLLNGIPLLNME